MGAYYAVKIGKNPGVYLNWEDCKNQVHGFPGAIYKKWKTREEAEQYLHGLSKRSEIPLSPSVSFLTSKTSSCSDKNIELLSILSVEKQVPEEEQAECLFREFDTNALAFVDGSFQKENGIYGYGVVFIEKNGILSKHKGSGRDNAFSEMRNVSGEILGAMRAVELTLEKGLSSLTIFHDYQGISTWAKEEWKCNKEKTREYRDYMKAAEKKIRLEFFKVPAHSGIYFNEMADALAKEAAGIKNGL